MGITSVLMVIVMGNTCLIVFLTDITASSASQ
jgi:hypothetical protein